jgi:hypothetical protein
MLRGQGQSAAQRLSEGNWEIIATSPFRYRPDSQVAREASLDE